jgi:pyruvate dehydrogenase E1 component beta subunit
VERTGRLLVAEEQVHHGGWGASLISDLTMAGISWRHVPAAVSLPYDLPIPYSPPLEDALIPSADRIAEAARAVVRG